jgi:hypothetical protein
VFISVVRLFVNVGLLRAANGKMAGMPVLEFEEQRRKEVGL